MGLHAGTVRTINYFKTMTVELKEGLFLTVYTTYFREATAYVVEIGDGKHSCPLGVFRIKCGGYALDSIVQSLSTDPDIRDANDALFRGKTFLSYFSFATVILPPVVSTQYLCLLTRVDTLLNDLFPGYVQRLNTQF